MLKRPEIEELGARIKKVRKAVKLTQEKLAKKLGIAYPTLNKYERGHRTPGADILNKIAQITECSPGWLLSGEGEAEIGEGAKKCTCKKFVIVYTVHGVIHEVFGSFSSLEDERLKEVLVEKGFLQSYEKVEARKWLAGPQGVSMMVCEANPDTSRILYF